MNKNGAFLCFLLLMGGCSTAADVKTETVQTSETVITFTDDTGQEISIEKPERTAALIGSFADIWCTAGGKDSLVAAAHDTWTSFDLSLDDSVQDLGEIKNPNLEVLIASQPDLVLASAKNESNLALQEQLEQAGIPAAFFDVSTFEDYLRLLKVCCDLTGNEEAYQQYGIRQQEEIENAVQKADGSRPTVLYIRCTGSSVKVKNSEGSVLGEMLKDLDTVNIADSDDTLLENLSLEAIAAADPEYIFVILQGSDSTDARASFETELLSSPVWASLQAVQEDRFYILDQNLYNLKPNARWSEAYMNLAQLLYGN